MQAKKKHKINLSKVYYFFLWAQIAFGILLFSLNFKEPLTLIIIGAVINAIAMFIHIGLVNWMNIRVLPKEVQAPIWRKIVIGIIFIFFGIFSIITIVNQFEKLL